MRFILSTLIGCLVLVGCSAANEAALLKAADTAVDSTGQACATLVDGAVCTPIPEHDGQLLCTFLERGKLHPFTVTIATPDKEAP